MVGGEWVSSHLNTDVLTEPFKFWGRALGYRVWQDPAKQLFFAETIDFLKQNSSFLQKSLISLSKTVVFNRNH